MIQVYTGDGKGKTTAAIGLAIRALGAGLRVYMMQFMKGKVYSEQEILRSFAPRLTLRTTGKPFFIAEAGSLTAEQKKAFGDDVVIFPKGKPPADYQRMIAEGFQEACEAARSGAYEVIILDEINVALHFGLLAKEPLAQLLQETPKTRELILTGRKAPLWLLEMADLVTNMQEVRHYYQQGVEARKGIEC